MRSSPAVLQLTSHIRARKAEQRARDLKAGLITYGHHRDGCAYMFNMPCSCGLVALLNGARR